MNKFRCGATVDIGCDRENQEDFVQFEELDEENLLCVIADGTGSRKEHPQPASIAVMDIIENIRNIYKEQPKLFFQNPEFFLKHAMQTANRLLGAFKLGNEEIYCGYAASVTCCLFAHDYSIYVAHCGNTRLYLMRDGKLKKLTRDHTKAAELLRDGSIDIETYHVHPDRLKMTSGIGVVMDPEIQTISGKIRDTDLVILTTDGVHYAVREPFIPELVLAGDNCTAASANLVSAAKELKYPDNMSAMVVHGNPDVLD